MLPGVYIDGGRRLWGVDLVEGGVISSADAMGGRRSSHGCREGSAMYLRAKPPLDHPPIVLKGVQRGT